MIIKNYEYKYPIQPELRKPIVHIKSRPRSQAQFAQSLQLKNNTIIPRPTSPSNYVHQLSKKPDIQLQRSDIMDDFQQSPKKIEYFGTIGEAYQNQMLAFSSYKSKQKHKKEITYSIVPMNETAYEKLVREKQERQLQWTQLIRSIPKARKNIFD